ncbi:MAG: peptide chain release factor 2 [Candidatus Margulisbacteria bacterium]|nr:peptide chain release factor 2 [Candidatus Margulisiibacteriota bacterium]
MIFDEANRQNEISQLEKEVTQDTFWQDQNKAKQVLAKIKVLKNPLEKYQRLHKDFEDLQMLIQLGQEEKDSSVLEEIQNGLKKAEKDLEAFEVELLLNKEFDQDDAIITLAAGAGGTDAQDWAEMLMRMYSRWAETMDYGIELVDVSAGDEAGIKSATMIIKGPYAYGYLKAEKGVHRLVRLSPYNADHKRHTSFAALDVIPDVSADFKIELKNEELRIDTYRASGAGGQHVNKTDSAVRITHLPTGVVVQCQSNRSQNMNREMAMRLLYAKLHQLMEEQHEKEIAKLRGEHKEIAWGNQIRSYVFHPYSLVKDHRTNIETSQVQNVMDGDLSIFIQGYLKKNIKK